LRTLQPHTDNATTALPTGSDHCNSNAGTRAHVLVQTFLNPPSAELEAGRRVEKHSNEMPRICW
jgi:hypothetical protein